MSMLSELYVNTLPPDQPPYQVDDRLYRRFDQRNNLTVGRPSWDPTVQKYSRQAPATRAALIQSGRPGYHVELVGGQVAPIHRTLERIPRSRDGNGQKIGPFLWRRPGRYHAP